MEDGHYRLHDLDSANGTFVNGDSVTDYHLRETCKISFGTMECEFDSAEVTQAPEGLPTHAELGVIRGSNEALKAQLEAVRTELASLRTESPLNSEGAGVVPREEFERVVLDRASLSERLLHSEAQVQKLREELAILRRDRENLERAALSARTELDRLRETPSTGLAVSVKPTTPVAAATAASVAVPATPPAAAPAAAPAMPPAAAPVMPSLPRPSSLPQPTATPVPRAMPVAATAPTSPGNLSLPKPTSPSLQGAQAPALRSVPRVVEASSTPVRATASGPAGTQKISVSDSTSTKAPLAQPVAVGVKPTLKPYVRPTMAHAPAGSVKPRDPRLQAEPEIEERQEA